MSELFSLIPFVDPELRVRLAITLLHFLWQGALVGGVAWIAEKTFGRSSSGRYFILASAILSLPPVVLFTFATIQVPATDSLVEMTPHVHELSEEANLSTTAMVPANDELPTDPDSPMNLISSPSVDVTSSAEPKEAKSNVILALAPYVTAGYLVGVLFFLVRLLIAVWGGQRLKAAAAQIKDDRLLRIVHDQSMRLGLRVVPMLAHCQRVTVPTVIGFLQPMILLPATVLTGLTTEQMQTVITHELAHIRRCDLLMNLVQRLIESLLFFHPIVWYLSRRLSAERETCCDDLVVSLGCDRISYAGTLLRMAELCSVDNQLPVTSLSAAGSSKSELEKRILRLLHPSRESQLRLTRGGLTLIAVLLLSAVTIASAFVSPDEQESETEPPTVSQPVDKEFPPTAEALLAKLRTRDKSFDNRTLVVERRWTEPIYPRSLLSQQKFNDFKFGLRDQEYPDPDSLPDDYNQPHRQVDRLTVRGEATTLHIEGDLEKQIHKNYGGFLNKGLRWSNAGKFEQVYNPTLKTHRLLGFQRYGVLGSYRRSYLWCSGYGYAKSIVKIRKMETKDNLLNIEADVRLYDQDGTATLTLDRNLIVRKAHYIMPRGAGANEYTVETFGTVFPKSALPVAKQGKHCRLIKPDEKRVHKQSDYEVVFTSLSPTLTDKQYEEATKIEPAQDVNVVDMRPNAIREAIPAKTALAAADDNKAAVADTTNQAVAQGIEFLLAKQSQDGSFGNEPAVTGLSGIALMDTGAKPGKGKQGKALQAAIDNLINLSNKSDNGMMGKSMYSHAYALRFLAETKRRFPEQKLDKAIKAGVKLIVDSQSDQTRHIANAGGWRYSPTSKDADLSVTSCVTLALLSAKASGAEVPAETIKRATAYIKGMQNNDGGFNYTFGGQLRSGIPRSAAAMSVLMQTKSLDEDGIKRGMNYLKTAKAPDDAFLLYTHYYLSESLLFDNPAFEKWYDETSKSLLEKQLEGGDWNSPHGNIYATAKACIILLSPLRSIEATK